MPLVSLSHPNLEQFHMDADKFAWDRLSRESERAFIAFKTYRDMEGQRRLQAVADRLHCSGANIRRWSRRWKWADRAREWDIYHDRVFQEEQVRERRAMAQRQAQQGRALQGIAAQELLKLQQAQQRQFKPGKTPTYKITARDIAYLMEVGSRMERRALGEPDSNVVAAVEVIVESDDPPPEEEAEVEALVTEITKTSEPIN